jgi:hypothetical protein
VIPRGVGGEFVAGDAGGIEAHEHGACRVVRVSDEMRAVDAVLAERSKRAVAEFVRADGTHHPRRRAKARGMTREICGRSAEVRGVGVNVPQHFTEPDDDGARTQFGLSDFMIRSGVRRSADCRSSR